MYIFMKMIKSLLIIVALLIPSFKAHSQIDKLAKFAINKYYSILDIPGDTEKFISKNVDFYLKSDSIKINIDSIEYFFKRRSFRKNPKSGKQLMCFIPKPLYLKNDFNNYKLLENLKILDFREDKIICVGSLKTVQDDNIEKEKIKFEIMLKDLNGIVIGL
jgi:hypothetical protein